jgi:purine-binding chemotaxis protein CheW
MEKKPKKKYNIFYNEIFNLSSVGVKNMAESYFTFSLGKGKFAVSVEFVREVINYEKITKVPKALSYIKGVVNIRGSIVTVIDFRELFGFEGDIPEEKNSIIVLEVKQEDSAGFVFGILADSVDVVTNLEKVVSENYDFGIIPERKEFICDVAKKDNQFVLIMDIVRILESIEKEIAEK